MSIPCVHACRKTWTFDAPMRLRQMLVITRRLHERPARVAEGVRASPTWPVHQPRDALPEEEHRLSL